MPSQPDRTRCQGANTRATPRQVIEREVIACLDDLPDSGHASLTIHVTRMKDGAVIVEHHQKKAPRVLRFGNQPQST